MILVNMTKNVNAPINGLYVQMIGDMCGISLNMNSIPGDKSPLRPSGIRIGTPQITTRGLTEEQMPKIFQSIQQVIVLTEKIAKSLIEAGKILDRDNFKSESQSFKKDIDALKLQNSKYIKNFPIH